MTASIPVTSKTFVCSRGKSLLAAGFCMGLFLLCLMMSFKDTSTWLSKMGAIVFAAFAVKFIIQALFSLASLTLTNEGFEAIAPLGSKKYAWSNCAGFSVESYLGPTAISFYGPAGKGLLFNFYQASTQEICETLTAWKHKFDERA
jgi:hypothetical protein